MLLWWPLLGLLSWCPVLTHWPLGDLYVIFEKVIFNLALLIGIFKSSYDNVLRWMPQNLTDDKSTLVQVMACCCQATSHYLNQCWPRSPVPYGVTRPQWVKVKFEIHLNIGHEPGDEICGCTIFKWVAETSLYDWIPGVFVTSTKRLFTHWG